MNVLAVIAGGLMLAAVFGGVVAVMARSIGWVETAAVWGLSLAATAVIAGGVCLAVWGVGAW